MQTTVEHQEIYKGLVIVVNNHVYDSETTNHLKTRGIKLAPWRCGYVGVDKTNLLYGVGYCNPTDVLAGKRPEDFLEVHGGLTYSGPADDKEASYPIPTIMPIWFFGFDTNHYGDYHELWPLDKVIEETKRLADQIATLEIKP